MFLSEEKNISDKPHFLSEIGNNMINYLLKFMNEELILTTLNYLQQ